MPFQDTQNKAVIRRNWDLPILKRCMDRLGRPLTYFGLPGDQVADLVDWKEILDARRTGVEGPGHTPEERQQSEETRGRLNQSIHVHEISAGFELVIADVEDVIIHGRDLYDKVPQLSDGRAPHLARFSYDLVNLDFDGGLGYVSSKRHGEAKRLGAIKKLFERQEGHSFVLLLTVNLRHKLGDEIERYLQGLSTRNRGADWEKLLSWYLQRGGGELDYKFKAIIPSFIQAASEPHMFRSLCHPPIIYEGYKHAHMMHFAFELEWQAGNLRAFSAQDDRDLVELPLLRSANGRLELAPVQHPGYDIAKLDLQLGFLPERTRHGILDCGLTEAALKPEP